MSRQTARWPGSVSGKTAAVAVRVGRTLHQDVAPDGALARQCLGKDGGGRVAVQQVEHATILRGDGLPGPRYWPNTSLKNFLTGPGSSTTTALTTRGAGGRGPIEIRRSER